MREGGGEFPGKQTPFMVPNQSEGGLGHPKENVYNRQWKLRPS